MAALVLGSVLALRRRRPLLAGALLGAAVHAKLYPIIYAPLMWLACGAPASLWRPWQLLFDARRWALLLGALASFGALTGAMYRVYGDEFLEHTYFYHVTRADPVSCSGAGGSSVRVLLTRVRSASDTIFPSTFINSI